MRKSLAIFTAFVLIFGAFGLRAQAAEFEDLVESHRFYEEMQFLKNERVIAGYPDGTFRPDEEVTRAAAAIMIGRVLQLNGEQRGTTFSDVGASQAASGYIASAVERGIINGFPDGTYRPDEPVTRGQMAIFLSRAFELEQAVDVPFSDVSPNMEAYEHIQRILAENITQGYPNNTYRPELPVTRAQFSAFLARALDDRFKEELTVSYSRDASKVYHYTTEEGETIFRHTGEKFEGHWDMWEMYINGNQEDVILEHEDAGGYYIGFPYSEYYAAIQYPAEVGRTWDGSFPGGENQHTITSTTETITTPAGTFTDVLAVESEGNRVEYYAPNVGIVKVTVNGKDAMTLTKLENQ